MTYDLKLLSKLSEFLRKTRKRIATVKEILLVQLKKVRFKVALTF